jgi:uncharacterized membrane-anchored protein
MRKLLIPLVLVVLSVVGVQAQQPNRAPKPDINWQRGPCVGKLGNIATIKVPAGFVFTGAKGTRTLMTLLENPTSGAELGTIHAVRGDWFAVFEFDPIGYVRDDEKGSLNADKILKSIKKGTAEGNKERAKRGWSTMQIIGWGQKPKYNPQTNNLEWSILATCEGQQTINYNTRLLGRRGVMQVVLVDGPETIAQSQIQYQKVLTGFEFVAGQRYAEYRQGDKLAKYGLTALIAGGAAAVAVKTGLFRYIWKGLVVLFVAIGGFFKKVFGGGRRSDY